MDSLVLIDYAIGLVFLYINKCMELGGNLKNHFDNWKILSISCKIFLLAHIIIYIILTYLLTILISLFLAFVILSAFNGKIGFNNIFFYHKGNNGA